MVNRAQQPLQPRDRLPGLVAFRELIVSPVAYGRRCLLAAVSNRPPAFCVRFRPGMLYMLADGLENCLKRAHTRGMQSRASMGVVITIACTECHGSTGQLGWICPSQFVGGCGIPMGGGL